MLARTPTADCTESLVRLLAEATRTSDGHAVALRLGPAARSLVDALAEYGVANLLRLGFTDVTDLVGGVHAWIAAGLPTTEPDHSHLDF